ncbi:MAG: hypothetical protein FWD57_03400 [Polyangiaceae bacterium]|nr:hypothetical protein [Polyangiaceae bacterium]
MKRVLRVARVVSVAVVIVACSVPQEADDSVQQQVQAVGSIPEEEAIDEAPGLAPDPLVAPHTPHNPWEGDGPSPSPVPEVSIEERMALPNWPQQLAEKQAYKEKLYAAMVGEPAPMPPVDPSVIAKQQRFLELVAERQAEFDALDPETREEVYADFKMKELAE